MVDPPSYLGATGPVRLVRDVARPSAFMLRIGGTDQSYVDLDDPRRLEFDYVQRIAAGLDACAPAGERLSTVHIGGALMTLPRYVTATRPRSPQIVLEPDVELTAFVRAQVPLPERSGIKVRPVGGVEGIAAIPDDYADAVILDAFHGSRVPPELTTVEFFADVARVLRPAGTLLINVTDRSPFDYARRVLAGVVQQFREVIFSAEPSTMKGRRFGNVVIQASDAEMAVEELVRSAAGSAFPYRVLSGGRVRDLLAGAAPFTAQDNDRSPEPPAQALRLG